MYYSYKICLVYIFINICTSCAAPLRIVFLVEKQQPHIAGWVVDVMREMEQRTSVSLDLQTDIIPFDRDRQEDTLELLCASLSQGVTVLLDLTWSPWKKVSQLADAWNIPYITGALGDGTTMLSALLQVLDVRNATDAVLIFQNEDVLEQSLYKILGNTVLRVLALHDVQQRAGQILDMRPTPGHYLMIGSTQFLQDTYKWVAQRGLVFRPDRWILVATDLVAYSLDVAVLKEATSIVSITQKTGCMIQGQTYPCNDDGAIIKIEPIILSRILKQVIDSALDANLHENELKPNCSAEVLADNYQESTKNFYNVLSASVNKNNTLLLWDDKSHGVHFRPELSLQTCGRDGQLWLVAVWSLGGPVTVLPEANLTSPRRFLRIGTTTAIPWTYPKVDPDTRKQLTTESGDPIYEGYCIDLIKLLANEMNFDYELVIPKSDGFGKKLPNGSWTGLIGDLAKGITDMAVAATVMTSQREEVVDFVAPYFEQTGLAIVLRKPIRKTSLFKFMTVLRLEVWLSIMGALILTAILLSFLDKYSPYSARNNKEAYPYPCREFTLKESLWFALTSFTPQGGGEAPKALSGRALVAAYWLFVVLMLATFTANLAAFLTVERMQTPVSSLEQLARQSRINYTVVEGSMAHRYFLNMKNAEDILYRYWKELTLNASSDELQYHVWDYPIREQYGHILLAINSSQPVATAQEGFRKVDQSEEADFAFIHDSSEIKYEITKNCNLSMVGEVFGERPYAIAVQQGSRLQEEVTRVLLILQRELKLEGLTAKYWNSTCFDNDDGEGITLDSLGGVFIATLFGLALAMVTLAWEVFYYKHRDKIEPFKQRKSKMKKDPSNEWNIVDSNGKKQKNLVKRITFGDNFKPVLDRNKISTINVEPKIWNP